MVDGRDTVEQMARLRHDLGALTDRLDALNPIGRSSLLGYVQRHEFEELLARVENLENHTPAVVMQPEPQPLSTPLIVQRLAEDLAQARLERDAERELHHAAADALADAEQDARYWQSMYELRVLVEPWQSGVVYRQGRCVSHDGWLWIANLPEVATEPAHGPSWTRLRYTPDAPQEKVQRDWADVWAKPLDYVRTQPSREFLAGHAARAAAEAADVCVHPNCGCDERCDDIRPPLLTDGPAHEGEL